MGRFIDVLVDTDMLYESLSEDPEEARYLINRLNDLVFDDGFTRSVIIDLARRHAVNYESKFEWDEFMKTISNLWYTRN